MNSTSRANELKREEIVTRVAGHLLEHGFANSGVRALAASAGISDRMLMYYFDTKEALIAQALLMLSEAMNAALDELVPQKQASAAQIIAALSVVDEDNTAQQGTLMLWFEIIGLAVRGSEPYKATANQILSGYEQWIAAKLPDKQKHRAREVLAQIEGQMMLTLLARDSRE